jgi:hypothetical protein
MAAVYGQQQDDQEKEQVGQSVFKYDGPEVHIVFLTVTGSIVHQLSGLAQI